MHEELDRNKDREQSVSRVFVGTEGVGKSFSSEAVKACQSKTSQKSHSLKVRKQ